MCDPVTASIAFGVVSAGLGIGQQVASYQQARQETAYMNAQAQQNYQFAMMQTDAANIYENQKQMMQETLNQQNAELAGLAYANDIGQLNLRIMQEQEAAAQKKQETGKAFLQAKGEVSAAGRVGNTVDNLIADYYRQRAQFDFATDRNLAFAINQTQQEKRGAAATYASRMAQNQPYMKQVNLDPIRPIERAAPSSLPYVLGGASAVAGGISSGFSLYSSLPKSPPPAPPFPKLDPGAAAKAFGGLDTKGITQKAFTPGLKLY